ncbi:MAG: 30S ribosomal protein S3 [Alphaproteobacteria bacterium MarineAlpha6_Bin4]|nr:MAG: 30S ribosomal protein S3 [Alphaproteobacteria bacterium MarineAlpha6_Bin3]PPR38299.1 MAG: 30S ribosomal protein S3 [Alphaproteobacteria bacterium MarineAlpha6_Bin4]|tara:strand:+ start:15701 stop:16375 length:675 start_codon:yes stop_codon:yes gene_type:complete
MGQKVNPTGLRLGINRTWDSRWYSDEKYSEFLENDLKIRDYIDKELKKAGISKVVIERSSKKIIIAIHASRPGIIIGKKGSDIEKLKKTLSKISGSEINLNIVETKKPELDAKVVADNIAMQIENRAATKRVMKRAVQSALKLGAKGIRVCVGGRIGGAEIARVEWFKEGRVPLHTLRAKIDYAVATAKTTYGTCGVKVWLYKGEKISNANDINSNNKNNLKEK